MKKLYINMKYLLSLSLLLIILTGCSSNHPTTTLTQDINESIIDGFYDGDTTGISPQIYLLR